MKKDDIGCPVTLGEYERVVKNKKVYENLNDEQKEWLEYYFNEYNYNFKNSVLDLKEGVLWLIINTTNSIREFEK